MHEVIKVGDLFGLPQHGYIFKLVDFYTLSRHSFGQHVIHFISIIFVIEGEIVRLIGYNFKTNLKLHNEYTSLSSYLLLKSFSILWISILSTALLERLWKG